MIFGLDPIDALPEGWTPLEALAIIKCLNDEGRVTLYLARTSGLTTWEQVGMADDVLHVLREESHEAWGDGSED